MTALWVVLAGMTPRRLAAAVLASALLTWSVAWALTCSLRWLSG